MNKLISIVNSGESLEKVAALITTAYKSNPCFYYSYDEVLVFYSDNIIKNKNMVNTYGLLSSLIDNCIAKKMLNIDKTIDIIKYRKQILKNLYTNKSISYRQLQKLTKDNDLFIKLVSSLPWSEIFPNHKYKIINYLEKKYTNLKIFKIQDLYTISDLLSQQPLYQSFGKLYYYDYNGSTITKRISKSTSLNHLKNLRDKSIYYTFNVFVLLIALYNYAKTYNTIIGYRLMKSSPRKSYDEAIKYVISNTKESLIEPRNYIFNECLSKYSFSLSINDRSTLAIYDVFKDIIDEIY